MFSVRSNPNPRQAAPCTGSSIQKPKNNISIKISVDTSELDRALDKAKELSNILEEISNRGSR